MVLTEVVIILVLTVVNGILAMSEIAIVSAKKVRLQKLADEGVRGAERALQLADSPNRFLSTVQIGITLVGILLGAFAGSTISRELAHLLDTIPALDTVSEPLSLLVVVILTTYLSLVIGELVPKRLGLQNPERTAALVAPFMHRLSIVTAPFVSLLSVSTDAVLRLMGFRPSDEPSVSEEEIHAMMRQGIEEGIFEAREQEMVAGVFSLDDRRIASLMTPRTEIEWLDLDDTPQANIQKIIHSKHSRFPAAHASLDQIAGVLRAKDLLNHVLSGEVVDLKTSLREPLFVPETAMASHVLELFKQSGKHMALVISEYGGIEGLVTLNNLIEQIIGEIDDPLAVQREDGSWLLDGLLPIDEVKAIFDIAVLPGEDQGYYQTLGGFVMTHLGRVPGATDHFEWESLRFEVMDMDGKRVDKVLVQTVKQQT